MTVLCQSLRSAGRAFTLRLKSVSNEKRIQLCGAGREPLTQNIGRFLTTDRYLSLRILDFTDVSPFAPPLTWHWTRPTSGSSTRPGPEPQLRSRKTGVEGGLTKVTPTLTSSWCLRSTSSNWIVSVIFSPGSAPWALIRKIVSPARSLIPTAPSSSRSSRAGETRFLAARTRSPARQRRMVRAPCHR